MLCTQAANGDSAFHTKLRLNVCELKAHATLDCTGTRHIGTQCREPISGERRCRVRPFAEDVNE